MSDTLNDLGYLGTCVEEKEYGTPYAREEDVVPIKELKQAVVEWLRTAFFYDAKQLAGARRFGKEFFNLTDEEVGLVDSDAHKNKEKPEE